MYFSLFRYGVYKKLLADIDKSEKGGLEDFTRCYTNFGIHTTPDGGVRCYEWCPGAQQLYLWGDFSKSFLSMLFIRIA